MSRGRRSEPDLRRRVERILGAPVTKAAWTIAVKQRMVDEVLQNENTVEWLSQQLKEMMDIIGSPEAAPEFIVPGRRQRRGKTLNDRTKAISEALAAIARQSDEVKSFRSRFLDSQLLRFNDVEQWIKERRQDCTYPHAVLVRVKTGPALGPSGWHLEQPLSLVASNEIEGRAPVDLLNYAKHGSNWVHCVPVGRDGTLRVVFDLSKALVNRFRWQEAQATMFLLTDITPLVATESVQFNGPPFTNLPWGRRLPLGCLTRITLTIDPMVTPRELSRTYAKLRADLLIRKSKVQSEKHLQLAVFAIDHPALDKEALGEWARRFAKWKYRRVSLFARDARMARDRLLHPRVVLPT